MVLIEDMVSRKHARISLQDGAITIADLGSTNGTFVNGEKVKKAELKEGDRVLIGTSILKLVTVQRGAQPLDARAAQQQLERSAAAQERKGRSAVQGRLEEVPLVDLLQLLRTSKKTGTIVIQGYRGGRVHLQGGRVVAAVIDADPTLPPKKALYRMVGWSQGGFEFVPQEGELPPMPNEIQESTEALVMEAMQQQDELARGTLPAPTAAIGIAMPLTPRLRDLTPAQVLRGLPVFPRPRQLLVGTETRDDAAVFRLDAKRALVATVDFFAPVVDDPRDYGAIAAANALSDVYAMGGRPLYALNLVGFPRGQPWEYLHEILAGGAEKAHEAGCPIVGGHSVDDLEPKYGLAVTGMVDPRRVLTNSGARPGHVILLTKALGTGIAVSAIKKEQASPELLRAAVAQMKILNRAAGETLARAWKDVHALTDVTGFGLLGHLDSMLCASGARAVVSAEALRLLPGVRVLAKAGLVPG